MARILGLRIQNYRSVSGPIEITFPDGLPVVLMGENNAGKSNILRALDLTLGHTWPGSHVPEDHEFYQRDPTKIIEIEAFFSRDSSFGGRYERIRWRCDRSADEPVVFRGYPDRYRRYDGFISNDDRASCMCVLLEADRNLGYHLSYVSKWTFLSRLMHRFHQALREDPATRTQLEKLFYEIKMTFQAVPQFSSFLANLRQQLDELLASMTHRLDVDFEAYNPVNFFHALRLHARERDAPRTLDELGTGEQQVLGLAFIHAYAKAFHGGVLLAIEEPEAHLHPLAQQWLAQRLRGMAGDGLQIILTTHSPAFIHSQDLEGLVLVSKSPSTGTFVTQGSVDGLRELCVSLGVPAKRVTAENLLPFYASSSTRRIMEGFFAKAIVLVEGSTESLAVPVYLRRLGFDIFKEGVAVIPVHGKGNLGKWYRWFLAFGIPVYVIFDNDGKRDDATGAKRRDALAALGLVEEDVDSLLELDGMHVAPDYAIFGSNFEQSLRSLFPEYSGLEEDARELGVPGKPFVAQWVANRLPESSVGWLEVQKLRDAILALLPVAPTDAGGGLADAELSQADQNGRLPPRRSAPRPQVRRGSSEPS